MKRSDLIEMIVNTLDVIQQIQALAEEALDTSIEGEFRGYYNGIRDQSEIAIAALTHIKGALEELGFEE